MAEEIITVDAIYKQGFEAGYWLKQGQYPELERMINNDQIHKLFRAGLNAGEKQANKDMVEKIINELNPPGAEYKKGFEIGYWMEKGNSSYLSQAIEAAKNVPDLLSGLKGGKKEAAKEKVREEIKQIREADKNRDKDRDMDKET